jgi:phosphatidylglycerophosphate synthase
VLAGYVRPLRRYTPSLVTGAGLALGAFGALLLPTGLGAALLVAGWLCDLVDGRVARALDACSEFGGDLDWLADVVVVVLVVARLYAPPAAVAFLCVLVPSWVLANACRLRVSGRTFVTALAVLTAACAN